MEKIQAALQKARTRRETGAQAPAAPRTSTTTGSPIAGRQARLWAELPEIALSGTKLAHHHVVTQKASEKATPFDIMRTKILLQMQQNGWKSIAITSPMPKSGKTTTACNLALGLGRQSGLRAMLFDLDLQDPSIGHFLNHTPEAPISDFLTGNTPFAEQAVRVGENVAISPSNRIETDPTRILLSPKTGETLDAVQATYAPDIMIYDMPSILVNDNTRAFLKNVDCALIVARANHTRYGHFDACEREVAEYTNVLGVVLNAFRTKDVQSYMD
ncbi:CpsD/CapB family tyrosine-protein kinase [Roseobacter sp. EG26]|uniref:CpsD/CapB family tyrosine-protein kinase n=1 Tax=Roseobacter sp. EG26 TaxID=3412477 RepID=UPI0026105BDC|nr:CpsD/CapB family tyrosine-protein kinase [uncultured Roseobacter sp.]